MIKHTILKPTKINWPMNYTPACVTNSHVVTVEPFTSSCLKNFCSQAKEHLSILYPSRVFAGKIPAILNIFSSLCFCESFLAHLFCALYITLCPEDVLQYMKLVGTVISF